MFNIYMTLECRSSSSSYCKAFCATVDIRSSICSDSMINYARPVPKAIDIYLWSMTGFLEELVANTWNKTFVWISCIPRVGRTCCDSFSHLCLLVGQKTTIWRFYDCWWFGFGQNSDELSSSNMFPLVLTSIALRRIILRDVSSSTQEKSWGQVLLYYLASIWNTPNFICPYKHRFKWYIHW